MDTGEFLKWLYEGIPIGHLTLWRKTDKKTFWFSVAAREEMAYKAVRMAEADGVDVYYGVGVRKVQLNSGRGSNEDVLGVPALWVDIDIADPATHKQEKLPPDRETAMAFLDTLPIAPSAIISSGYGLHVYWKLDSLLDTDEPHLLRSALKLMQGWQQFINGEAVKRGWKLDSVHDAARVLRLPGTKNYKNPLSPRNVEVLRIDQNRVCAIEVFKPYALLQEPEAAVGKQRKEVTMITNNSKSSQDVISGCAFIQHCIENAASLTEPEWHAFIANLALCQDGSDAVQKASRPYSGYTFEETQAKILRALEENKPHTCEYIHRDLGFDCPAKGCGVKAPIVLANEPHRALASAKNVTPETAFDPEVLSALALVYRDHPGEWGKVKAKLKGKVNLNDLERAVKKAEMELQNLQNTAEGETIARLGDYWPVPDKYRNLLLPTNGWRYTSEGVNQVKYMQNRGEVGICASSCPVFISGRILNTDSSVEQLEISYYRDGKWSMFRALRSTCYDKRGIVTLGNYGVVVSSNSADRLIQYLEEFERINLKNIPLIKAVSRMGWMSNTEFIWGPAYGGEYLLEINPGNARWANGYHESGTIDEWKKNMEGVRSYPIARFMMAASFAAPLLKPLKERVFMVNIWGPTQGGKTAALKAALSVWGNPEKIMATFNATAYAIEQIAGLYNDLPLGIDERQIVGNNQESLEKLVYSISTGSGKVRGLKDGGMRTTVDFRSILLTTGEESITKDSSAGGIGTRTIEPYGLPLGEDGELAASIHRTSVDTFGTAGPLYIRRLKQEDAKDLVELHKMWMKKVKAFQPKMDGSHVSTIACVILGDFLSSKWIWEVEDHQAQLDAEDLLKRILQSLEFTEKPEYAARAYDHIMSWIGSNEKKFMNDPYNRERYGGFDPKGEYVYILPHELEKALMAGNFEMKRTKKDWATDGIILMDRSKKYSVNKCIDGLARNQRVVALRLGEYGHRENHEYKLTEFP